MCLFTWGTCVFTTTNTPTHACLSSLGSPSYAGIWRGIKAGERDALQVLNWISCWISGTSLKCMWASPNDAFISELQRHSVSVCLCLHVFLHQLAQSGWWRVTDMFALSVEVVVLFGSVGEFHQTRDVTKLWQGMNPGYIQQTHCLE